MTVRRAITVPAAIFYAGDRLAMPHPMTHEILINVTPQETRVAMLEQAVVQELHIERQSARGLVGNIYLGRVARVLPGMQSAFVEIGLDRAAFLHIADIWEHRQSGGEHRPIEKILHEGQTLPVLRDMSTDETARVIVDSRETFVKMQEFAREYTPALTDRIDHYVGERPLYDLHGVEEEIEKALGRRVDLKSGGYLIIDQTEAMTTIDVNTGSYVHGRNFDDTIFKTNLEAAQAIARQLRLRNLGGIIILDFIDMDSA